MLYKSKKKCRINSSVLIKTFMIERFPTFMEIYEKNMPQNNINKTTIARILHLEFEIDL